ncbi:DNA replication/repair protein RecF [Neomicrococcus aestuarii]|uniref:DNA replication/repair protein RecF n=1 Tax=Neomicrococcus aestuarii TaxID=556325 RepID=UPI0016190A67|nr:DNA replication/repair protein RecF [Neomicrococcus aestuarii]
MFITHLSLTDYRTYQQADIELGEGTFVFVGSNGVGKTNVVESINYLAHLASHRVSNDAPLVRFGAPRAIVRARVERGSDPEARQAASVQLEITPKGANRARINRSNNVRAADILGIVRCVMFAPEDLEIVKGDPSVRRRFFDDFLVTLQPAQASNRKDYDRVLRQRNALLKSAKGSRSLSEAHAATLEVWDQHLAQTGARLLKGRLAALAALTPHLVNAYAGLTDGSKTVFAHYRSSILQELEDDGAAFGAQSSAEDASVESGDGLSLTAETPLEEIESMFRAALLQRRKKEMDRGLTLVGPHRDEIELFIGDFPAKGFASHGETWSLALALRLACFETLLDDDPTEGAAPILILDDVFAELDSSRRAKLLSAMERADQVLITAAVAEDVPSELQGTIIPVSSGVVGSA